MSSSYSSKFEIVHPMSVFGFELVVDQIKTHFKRKMIDPANLIKSLEANWEPYIMADIDEYKETQIGIAKYNRDRENILAQPCQPCPCGHM